MGHHARLSCSSPRWPNCAGSVREERPYPNVSGDAAVDGTGSHFLLELCINTRNPNTQAASYVGQVIGLGHEDKPEGWSVDPERAKRVQVALDYIRMRDDEVPSGLTVETESESNPGEIFGRDDWYGTCDVTLAARDLSSLEVVDYKDGFVYVDVNNNSQLISYAFGKLVPHLFKSASPGDTNVCQVKKIRMTIVQPKIVKQPIRFVEMTTAELFDAAKLLAQKAALTDAPDAPLTAGDWCKWCKHSDNCAERNQGGADALNSLVTLGEDEGQASFVEILQGGELAITSLTVEQLEKVVDNEGVINALFTNARKELTARIVAGNGGTKYRIGKGKMTKKWKDPEDVLVKKLRGMHFLKEDIYPTSLVTPAQALKKEGLSERQLKRFKEELIVEKEGKGSLIKSSFEKKSVEEMFLNPSNTTDHKPITEKRPVEEMFPNTVKLDLSNVSFL